MKLALKEFGERNGRGTVILIHGTGARAEMWEPQRKLLVERGWHCLLPDLRGHGDSDEPGEVTDISVHIKDVLDTLDELDIQYPVTFAGHSLGAIVSMELASQRPDMFKQILAVSMPGKVPQLTVAAFHAFLGWPYSAIRGSAFHKNLGWRERVLLDTNHFSLSQIAENFGSLNYVGNLPKVACPVHFAVGRLDPVAPWNHVKAMHLSLPGSTLEVIEMAGHNCMDSQPKAFNKWFLSRLESP
jgi:pimeloyl-ACP methyl ester carboxylesterase